MFRQTHIQYNQTYRISPMDERESKKKMIDKAKLILVAFKVVIT